MGKTPQFRKIKRRALLPVEDSTLCQILVALASVYFVNLYGSPFGEDLANFQLLFDHGENTRYCLFFRQNTTYI
jgi:hypothetical protein